MIYTYDACASQLISSLGVLAQTSQPGLLHPALLPTSLIDLPAFQVGQQVPHLLVFLGLGLLGVLTSLLGVPELLLLGLEALPFLIGEHSDALLFDFKRELFSCSVGFFHFNTLDQTDLLLECFQLVEGHSLSVTSAVHAGGDLGKEVLDRAGGTGLSRNMKRIRSQMNSSRDRWIRQSSRWHVQPQPCFSSTIYTKLCNSPPDRSTCLYVSIAHGFTLACPSSSSLRLWLATMPSIFLNSF